MTLPKKRCARVGCPNDLTGKQVKYCGNSCRRIQDTANKRAVAESVALEEIKEQVRPVIREHLTEKVMQELGVTVDLLPDAIAALAAGLKAMRSWTDGDGNLHEEPDYAERRQAAALLLKYTVGNDSIKPEGAASAPPAFNINFGMPSQGDHVDAEGSVLEQPDDVVEVEADRECVECQLTKPADQFEGESRRCSKCHETMLDGMRERFPDLLPSRT